MKYTIIIGKRFFQTNHMQRILEYKISAQYNNMPIDLFLKSMGFSASNIIALKKIPRSILKNGIWEYVNTLLYTGDTLTIMIQELESSPKIKPVSLPLSILYEDEDLLIVNKPANMPIHPSMGNYDNTLANAVMYYFNAQDIPYVFRCVNRLDRDTTGLTILAKHFVSGSILSEMVARREINRTYHAIVAGQTKESGEISSPIGRKEGSTIERCIDHIQGESAYTTYKTLSYNPIKNLSLVELKLGTGRTHQIRVHMKSIGHPLIGDYLYNPDMTYMNRVALHSYSLSFRHPITKEPLYFSTTVPDDMNIV